MESLINNDGTSTPPVLLLRGTIPMQYKGITYHLPIDLYLPPNYPYVCPTVYVRPVSTMSIKPNHKHVGLDGMVYLPYLAQWKPPPPSTSTTIKSTLTGSNLKELVAWMSQLFGNEPPCFAKPIGASAAASGAAGASQGDDRWEPIPQKLTPTKTPTQEESLYERSRQREEQWLLDEAKLSSLKSKATEEIQANMKSVFTTLGEEIRRELEYQKKLEYGKEQIELLQKEYEVRRGKLREESIQLELANDALAGWLAAVEKATSSRQEQKELDTAADNNAAATTTKADLMALPTDTPSSQMLALSAESASIDDTIYFLDQALVRNTITLEIFLREVRRLSKRQFLAKVCLYR
jgi:ESCRT-I complex subunit TSG101